MQVKQQKRLSVHDTVKHNTSIVLHFGTLGEEQ